MKNVLYLSYDGMTDPLGQSQVLPYLKGLSKAGYTIHLVSFEKMDRFRAHRSHIEAICKSADIQWHPQDYAIKGSKLDTWRQVKRMRKIAFYLNDKHHFDIVHCRSYISALAGLQLKRKKGVKFIFDMRGFWADERVDGGLWDLKNPVYKRIYNYFKKKEIQFFKESDYTISLTENGKREIESWKALQGHTPKIEVIPCCVDLSLFDPTKFSENDKDQLRSTLGVSKEDFILGYIGSIGTWYMLSEMLDYFLQLKSHTPNAKFLFISGEKPSLIQELAAEKGIHTEDIIVRSVLHYEVPRYVSLFDKSIFFIRPSYSKKASSPTKQGEIMAMGIPLICNSGVGDTAEIVMKYKAGIVVDEFNNTVYQNVVSDLTSYDPESIIHGAKAYFSLEEGVNRYLSVYKAVHE
ncbi:MAG: glycosyltransferase [Crocinitomicaceae bacterium]|nr:glycosyltransferase [Crocinitomicaceae bacterium]